MSDLEFAINEELKKYEHMPANLLRKLLARVTSEITEAETDNSNMVGSGGLQELRVREVALQRLIKRAGGAGEKTPA